MTAPRFHISNLDAVEWLRSLPSGQINLLITDPPYESLEKHRAVGTTTRLKHSKSSSNDWFSIFPNTRFEELFREVYRVLAKDAHFYLFCDQETMFVAKPIGEAVGFKFWKPLVWDKQKIGMGYHYRARYEFVLFFEKGKRKLNDLGIPDVISAPRIRGGYPTEKPVDVCKVLVSQSTEPGDIVADPFCGAGASCVAAAMLGRHALGNDVSQEAIDLATSRLTESGAVLSSAVEILGPAPAKPPERVRRVRVAVEASEPDAPSAVDPSQDREGIAQQLDLLGAPMREVER